MTTNIVARDRFQPNMGPAHVPERALKKVGLSQLNENHSTILSHWQGFSQPSIASALQFARAVAQAGLNFQNGFFVVDFFFVLNNAYNFPRAQPWKENCDSDLKLNKSIAEIR